MPPTGPKHVWAYDFVFDACADGKQLECLTVVDEWTRGCLAIDVAGSIRSRRVVEVLARLVSVHAAPAFMRSDNGPEFVSNAILNWGRRRRNRKRAERSGQAVAERNRREPEWEAPRRVPQHGTLSQPARSRRQQPMHLRGRSWRLGKHPDRLPVAGARSPAAGSPRDVANHGVRPQRRDFWTRVSISPTRPEGPRVDGSRSSLSGCFQSPNACSLHKS
jgi:hypothetical protein